jgi:hypothetical protein
LQKKLAACSLDYGFILVKPRDLCVKCHAACIQSRLSTHSTVEVFGVMWHSLLHAFFSLCSARGAGSTNHDRTTDFIFCYCGHVEPALSVQVSYIRIITRINKICIQKRKLIVCKHMFCCVQINISMATRTELKTLFDTAYFIVSSRK